MSHVIRAITIQLIQYIKIKNKLSLIAKIYTFILSLSLPPAKNIMNRHEKDKKAENITNIFFVQHQYSDMLVDTVWTAYTPNITLFLNFCMQCPLPHEFIRGTYTLLRKHPCQ